MKFIEDVRSWWDRQRQGLKFGEPSTPIETPAPPPPPPKTRPMLSDVGLRVDRHGNIKIDMEVLKEFAKEQSDESGH